MLIEFNRGHSVIQWTVTLGLIVVAFAVASSAFKRALYTKSYGVTDYLLWNNTPQDVTENTSSFTRSKTDQGQDSAVIYINGSLNATMGSQAKTDTFTVSEEDGSAVLLRNFTPPW
jgi:hypothetical protein